MNQPGKRSDAIDVARGCCLVIMTIDHLPGNVFSRFSNAVFGPLGFFTAASCFVFISGLVSARVYGRAYVEKGSNETWQRALRRCLQIYSANTTILFIVWLGISLQALDGPFWQQEFSLVRANPWEALLRGALLLYRPGYCDILPMYIFFLLCVTPAIAAIRASHSWMVLLVSLTIWGLAQTAGPSHSLNPFGYQLLFVCGLLVGSRTDLHEFRGAARLRLVVWVSSVVVVVLMAWRFIQGLQRLPDVTLLGRHWLMHLENNGPLRLINFLLFALVVYWWWPTIFPGIRGFRLVGWLARLGQHSLVVFVWSVAATYISIALMPLDLSRASRLADVLLTVSSLWVPASLHAWLMRRDVIRLPTMGHRVTSRRTPQRPL